jgi:hypothetical protein
VAINALEDQIAELQRDLLKTREEKSMEEDKSRHLAKLHAEQAHQHAALIAEEQKKHERELNEEREKTQRAEAQLQDTNMEKAALTREVEEVRLLSNSVCSEPANGRSDLVLLCAGARSDEGDEREQGSHAAAGHPHRCQGCLCFSDREAEGGERDSPLSGRPAPARVRLPFRSAYGTIRSRPLTLDLVLV